MKERGRIGKDSPHSPQKILLAPSLLTACVAAVLLLVPHCPCLSFPVSLGWGLV